MNNLIKIFCMILLGFVSTQSFASIDFEFKHIAEPNNLPQDQRLTMYVSALSKSGAHLAESSGHGAAAGDEMLPGESSHDYTTTSIFAPDATGTYTVRINCYIRSVAVKSMQSYAQDILVPKDGSTVFVEAACPVLDQGQGYALLPPKDVKIKVVDRSKPVE